MGLSWWLMPADTYTGPLSSLINQTALKYDGLPFPPHITLLTLPYPTSPEELEKKVTSTTNLCDTMRAFRLDWKSIDVGQTFYQSVLVSIASSEPLDGLYYLVRRQNTLPPEFPDPPHFPHLSLFYGEPSMRAKEVIAADLHSSSLDRDGSVMIAGLENIEVDAVWLVRTDGMPSEWETLAKYKLGSA